MSALTKAAAKTITPNPIVLANATIEWERERESVWGWETKTSKEQCKIQFCVTRGPHDWFHMYRNGPGSCMSFGGDGGEGTERPFDWMIDYKLHPMSSLAFNPHIRGVYVKNGRHRTIWRALAINHNHPDDEDIVKKGLKGFTVGAVYFGRKGPDENDPYVDGEDGSAADLQKKLQDTLVKEFGLTIGGGGDKWAKAYTVEIAPIEIANFGPLMTWPYFDNHTQSNRLTLMKNGNFKFEAGVTSSMNWDQLHSVAVDEKQFGRTLSVQEIMNAGFGPKR